MIIIVLIIIYNLKFYVFFYVRMAQHMWSRFGSPLQTILGARVERTPH